MAVRRVHPVTDATAVVKVHAPSDIDLMRAALGATEITVDIPKDATLEEVKTSLNTIVKAQKGLYAAAGALKPVIGRYLLEVRNRKLFKPAYKTFTDFYMNAVVVDMGLPRSTALEALKIAKAFPALKIEQYFKYGSERLLAAATITDQEEENWEEVLDQLNSVTVEEAWASVKALEVESGDAGETGEAVGVVAVRGPVSMVTLWKGILAAQPEGTQANEVLQECLQCYLRIHTTIADVVAPSHDLEKTLKKSVDAARNKLLTHHRAHGKAA